MTAKPEFKSGQQVVWNGKRYGVVVQFPMNRQVKINGLGLAGSQTVDASELFDSMEAWQAAQGLPVAAPLQAAETPQIAIEDSKPDQASNRPSSLHTLDLQPHPRNQAIYGAEDASELVDQIAKSNWIKAIVINAANNRIISGHRRWLAAKELGLNTVPVEYRTFDSELEELEALLLENANREKTPEQKVREADVWGEIESERAAKRRLATLKQGDEKPDSANLRYRETGKTSTKVAEKVAMKERTYEKAKKVVQTADKLSGEGRVEEAKQLLDVLNDQSIDAAYKQIVKPHVANNSGENEWYTPSTYIEAARRAMGGIDLDPASSVIANQIVCAPYFYTLEDDGLRQDWTGRVWLNPPYSQPEISQFSTKVIEEHARGEAKQFCILVNNATETAWLQALLKIASAVCFLQSRIKFLDQNLDPKGAPLQGQVVVYIGAQTDAFANAFGSYGKVLYAE